MVFDLPPEYEPIEKYQGTLGHKINHKFDSDSVFAPMESARYGILLPKLFWSTVRKNCSSDREKLLKFKAEGQEFAKFLRSLGQFIQTVKGQNNFW